MTQASTLSVRTDKDLMPNKTTLKAVEGIEKGKNVKRFETAEELFEDLGISGRIAWNVTLALIGC